MKRPGIALLVTAMLLSSSLVIASGADQTPTPAPTPAPATTTVDATDVSLLRQLTHDVIIANGASGDVATLDQEMSKLGWKPIGLKKADPEPGIQSVTRCGVADPHRAYEQSNGVWVVIGRWRWNDEECINRWIHDKPMRPEDVVAMAVTDANDNPVDVPATNAGGGVNDQTDKAWPGIVASVFNRSSVAYAMDDRTDMDGFYEKFIGHHGVVYFWLNHRPTTPGVHFLHVCWKHNWASPALQTVEISWPFALKAVYSGNAPPNEWALSGACQRSELVYESL